MPASVVSASSGVAGALRLALDDQPLSNSPHAHNSHKLESQLSSGARASLLTPVHFEEAGHYHHRHLLHPLKTKYLLLKAEDGQDAAADAHAHAAKNEQDNSLPSPKRVLFPLSSVRHGWRQGWQTGSGMQNIGNTCYLNSTLQALFHVSAFANWLISENHGDKCNQQSSGCIICGMRKTLVDTQNSGGSIKPWQVYSNLRLICRHLIPGRQEDAHEFLRYLVEAMEKTYLSQFDCKQLDQYSKETTPLNQILGGYLRSVVRCLACGRVSTTFQHFQDLLVDARKASTIDEALEYFFSRERLEDLGYKCEFCNKKVSATKQFYIERAPMVLCIALKRFSITGGKLTKHVQFKTRLSLNKFMHNQNNSQQLGYRLVSLVTHLGQSQNCGHYTAVGYTPSGSFYQFDDSCVREIPLTSVLNTNAYIMFYELCSTMNSPNKNNVKSSTLSSSQTLKESKENIPNAVGVMTLKPFKTIEISTSKLNGIPESHLSADQDKSVSLKSKSLGNVSFSKNSNFKLNENDLMDSSKEKSFSGISSNLGKNMEHKVNGSSNGNSFVLNKITYFNLNNSSSNNMQNGKNSNKPILISTTVMNGKSSNDKNPKTSNEHKLNHTQNGEQKHLNHNKITNGNHKSDFKNHIENKNNVQKVIYGPHLPPNESSSSKTVVKKSNGLNGSTTGVSSLVPYDSDGDNQDSDDENSNSDKNGLQLDNSSSTKSTLQGWKVSHEKPEDRLGVSSQKSQLNNRSPNSENHRESPNISSNSHKDKDKETIGQLQRLSHRGYGAHVSTWNGTHTQLNRQVFEDKKSEMKRAADAEDEMDRGRVKKVKYNNYNNKYYNRRHNNYNPFQDNQNHINKWGSKNGFKKFHHHNRSFKHKSRGRFTSHYPRHHSNNHYHQYNRNH